MKTIRSALQEIQAIEIYHNIPITAATFENAAKTKLESSLDVQTRNQCGRPTVRKFP